MKKTKDNYNWRTPSKNNPESCDLWDTENISNNWEQQSQHSHWPLNKEWQGQHSQFLRCFFLSEVVSIDKKRQFKTVLVVTDNKFIRHKTFSMKWIRTWKDGSICHSCSQISRVQVLIAIPKCWEFIFIPTSKLCEWAELFLFLTFQKLLASPTFHLITQNCIQVQCIRYHLKRDAI